MTDRQRRDGSPAGDSERPAIRPSIARLLVISAALVLGLLTGQSLLAPLLLGWTRAEEYLALEDRMVALQTEEGRLREDIEYRKTEGGKKLAALETVRRTDPGARVIELTPKPPEEGPEVEPTLGERMEALRKKGRNVAYRKWRVMSFYLFDRKLPPPDEQ